MIGDDLTCLDAHHQPSSPALNPLHALGHGHIHIPPLVIVDANMFPQMRMGDVLALLRTTKEKAGVLTPRFFNWAQRRVAPPPVPFVWDATNTNTPNAWPQNSGTERRPSYEGRNKGGSSFSTASQSVSTSRPWQDARTHHTHLDTSVQDVGRRGMVPSTVLRHRKTNPLTPYKPDAWRRQLERHGLLGRYPYLSLTQVSMLEFLAYNKLTFLLIVHLLISIPRSTKKLWRQNFRKEDTLALSLGLSLSPLSDLSNPPPSPLLPNPENQENTTWYMISHTCAHHAQIQFNLSILPSVHRIFPAPAEISPQYVSSSIACHQGSRLPSEMCLKLIRPSLSITANGQAWWCNLRVKTTSQQTQTTVLASPQQARPMASLLMQEQISST